MWERSFTMKRISLLLTALLLLLLCGCSSGPDSPQLSPQYQPVEFPLPMLDGDDTSVLCCYADEKQTILAVGCRNDATTGPLYDTAYLCLYGQGEPQYIPVDADAYIISALPWQDGVLYVDYAVNAQGTYDWALTLQQGDLRQLVSTGTASSYDQVPALFLLNGSPVYLWQSDGCFGVNAVKNGAPAPIWQQTGTICSLEQVCCNGSQYCFVAAGSDGVTALYVGDAGGFRWKLPLEEDVAHLAINDTHAVCLTRESPESQVYTAQVMALDTGAQETFPLSQPLWRGAGSGHTLLAVDNDFRILAFDSATGAVSQFPAPEEKSYQNWPVVFYPTGSDTYLAHFTMEHEPVFYRLTVSSS